MGNYAASDGATERAWAKLESDYWAAWNRIFDQADRALRQRGWGADQIGRIQPAVKRSALAAGMDLSRVVAKLPMDDTLPSARRVEWLFLTAIARLAAGEDDLALEALVRVAEAPDGQQLGPLPETLIGDLRYSTCEVGWIRTTVWELFLLEPGWRRYARYRLGRAMTIAGEAEAGRTLLRDLLVELSRTDAVRDPGTGAMRSSVEALLR
jgi:hypothetical protein